MCRLSSHKKTGLEGIVMKKLLMLTVCTILATILGVYGQWIAYFMSENHPLNATYYLTACTVLSMLLYVVSYVLASILLRSKKISEWKVAGLFLAISIIAVPVSMFSFLATAMWWG